MSGVRVLQGAFKKFKKGILHTMWDFLFLRIANKTKPNSFCESGGYAATLTKRIQVNLFALLSVLLRSLIRKLTDSIYQAQLFLPVFLRYWARSRSATISTVT